MKTHSHLPKRLLLSFASLLLIPFAFSDIEAASYSNPMVSSDTSGNVRAIWEYFDDYLSSIQTASHSIGQPWSHPITLSDPSFHSFQPTLAINEQGDCVVAWLIEDPIFKIIAIAARTKQHDSEEWTPVTILSRSYEISDSSFCTAIDDSGNISISWKSFDTFTNENAIFTRLYSPSVGWLPGVQISE